MVASDSPLSPGLSRSEARMLTRMGSGVGQGGGAWAHDDRAAPANSTDITCFRA